MDDLLYKDTTFEIRGACFSVWNSLGGAFKEKMVDKALTIELEKRGLKVEDQKRIDIFYEGQKVGTYVPDKIVEEKVLLEVKSKEFITAQDVDQFWKYLKGSNYKVGLLVNFGPKKLEIKRIVYDTARSALNQRKQSALNQRNAGFTLMEIVVATTLFVTVFMAMLSLFDYTLKINRRTEALRQASQGMRNFVEYLVKEIRNGQIDYYISGGQTYTGNLSPCQPHGYVAGNSVGAGDRVTYAAQSNWLGIINTDGVQECFYYGKPDGTYIDIPGSDPVTFSSTSTPGTLVMQKGGIIGPLSAPQILNPSNFNVDNLMFIVRPAADPYTKIYTGSYPKVPPVVNIFIKFTAKLPTGEQVPIYYQTSVATNQYDIPTQ